MDEKIEALARDMYWIGRPELTRINTEDESVYLARYKMEILFAVTGFSKTSPNEKEKLGRNGRMHEIESYTLSGRVLFPTIDAVLDPEYRRQDIRQWMKKNADKEFGISTAGEILAGEPALEFYDRFVDVSSPSYKRLVGQVATYAQGLCLVVRSTVSS